MPPRQPKLARHVLGRHRVAGIVVSLWILLTLLLYSNYPSSSAQSSVASVRGAKPSNVPECPAGLDLQHRPGTFGIFGSSWTKQVQELEAEHSAAWKNPQAKVLVLGQQGYVKRDLPVYAQAFEGFTLLPRPASGKIDASHMVQGDEFDVILCLSFNTDHCLDSDSDFDLIGPARKINRIQSLRDVIWSKHKFCSTMTHALGSLKDKELRSVTFPCWVMPEDYDKMLLDSQRDDIERWISKPRALGAGMGITIVDNLEELAKERHSTHVVQAYMTDPLLVRALDNGLHKWDARTYVLVTSVVPLRAYVYSRGLVRLATSPYSSDCKSHNQTACLTNTSINKKVEGSSSHKLKDITWSFKTLQKYFEEEGGMDYADLFLRMQLAIGTVLLSAEDAFVKAWNGAVRCQGNCYQLLGVDVIFDSAGNARVVEVNGEPSLRLTSGASTHYDVTKKSMAKDLVALVLGKESGRAQLVTGFSKLAKCGGGKPYVTKKEVLYALDMFREANKLGGFRSVYPNKDLHAKHRVLLEHFRTLGGALHGDGSRLRAHDLIGALLGVGVTQPQAAKVPPNGDDADNDEIED